MSLRVLQVYPDVGETGLPLLTEVKVVFSEQIDIDTITAGNFVVATLAKNVVLTGPIIHDWANLRPLESLTGDLLESPTFDGLIVGTFEISDDRLTAIFRPEHPYNVNCNHIVLLSQNILTRTIGPISQGSYGPIQGNGLIELVGPYLGTQDDSIIIRIQTSGSLDSATFVYWFSSDPFTISDSITLDRSVRLDKNLIVRFAEGNYVAGDTWFAQLYVGEPLESLYSWGWSTGDGALVEPPTVERSVSLLDAEISYYDGPSEIARITYMGYLEAEDVPITVRDFTIVCTKALDPTTVNDNTVKVFLHTLGSYNTRPSTPIELAKTMVLENDDLHLHIHIQDDAPIGENMELTFMLSGLKDINGLKIADVTQSLTTRLNPFYTTVDRIRIELGPYINLIPSDTIARLIFNYSSAAAAMNFQQVDREVDQWFDWLTAEWVVCSVIASLMDATVSIWPGEKSKTLGDLSVSMGRTGLTPKDVRDKAQACKEQLAPWIKNGGYQYLPPMIAIKGLNSHNRPRFGRSWLNVDKYNILPIVANFDGLIFNRYYKSGAFPPFPRMETNTFEND